MTKEEDTPKEPTFEELFEANPVTPEQDFRPGETVVCEVVKISRESIFVDLGGKSEGVVDKAEFLDKEGALSVKIGDQMELKVASVTDTIHLSKGLKVKGAQAIEVLLDAFRSELPVEGRVAESIKGGFQVDISGVRAFCPISQIDIDYCENPDVHVGARYTFRIQEFKERGRNIIVSRRVLLEEEREKLAQEVLKTLQPGQKMEGKVTRLMNFGAFVDIGGIEGMVHISEMAHYRLRHPSELLQVGNSVNVQVLQCEPGPDGRTRISLSMKALEPTPWEKGLGIREGEVMPGKVTRLMDFGAFVELVPGVEGLVHVSEISYNKIPHPKQVLEEDQQVDVRILAIDQEKKRISLSIKEAQSVPLTGERGKPRESGEVRLQEGARFRGVVEKVSPNGLRVRLPEAGPGVQGFLPQEELGLASREDMKKTFPAGTEIEVVVLSVDEKRGIRLSRKAVKDQEARKEYTSYMDQGGKSDKLATFGDLFKDLKLPKE